MLLGSTQSGFLGQLEPSKPESSLSASCVSTGRGHLKIGSPASAGRVSPLRMRAGMITFD